MGDKKAKKPNKAQNKARSKTLKLIFYILFCIIWTGGVIVGMQLLIGYAMLWLLRESFVQPVWRGVYEVLVYGLSLLLIIFAPAKIWNFLSDIYTKKSTKRLKNRQKIVEIENPFKNSRQEMGVDKWPTFTDIALAPIGYIINLFVAAGFTQLMSNFSWFNANEAQETGFYFFVNNFDHLIAIICIVFLAPIAEELIMRGWLFGKLRNKLGFVATTLLVSLAFAILHFQWNVGVVVFSLSIILCTLREMTGSIWSGVLLHILQNGFAFYLLYSML